MISFYFYHKPTYCERKLKGTALRRTQPRDKRMARSLAEHADPHMRIDARACVRVYRIRCKEFWSRYM